MGWAGTPKDYRDALLAAWLKGRDIDAVVRSTSGKTQFAWLCREVQLAEAQLPKRFCRPCAARRPGRFATSRPTLW